MLFCAQLMIQVKHRPYLPPLLPQRPRCPQPRSSYPGCAAPGPLLPAVPRGSHTAAARPPPALLRQLRAQGGRLRGHVCSRRVPARKRRHLPGAGRAAPSSRRACSGDGGRAVAPPPAAPSRRWQRRSAWGRYRGDPRGGEEWRGERAPGGGSGGRRGSSGQRRVE